MAERERDKDSDTITAIATPPGFSGIGIVRISGKDALSIADKLFQGKRRLSELSGYQACYGWVVEEGEKLDEVIALVMRAPRSYTREDVVEFHCHGGPVVLKRVLEAVLRKGARLAEPGEFTKRAFLAGRIDLSQAEAVSQLIFAQTESAARSALRGLAGELGEKTRQLRQRLVEVLADLEAGLDFAEEDIEFISPSDLLKSLREIDFELSRLINRAQAGMILSEGINLVIAGRPNVGKSTLMNALLERDRVIVTPYPGTTRDVVEEVVNIAGVPVRLSDTAGIRREADEIEKYGVERSYQAISRADLVLLLLDGSEPLTDHDQKLLKETEDKNRLIIINKIDLAQKISEKELSSLLKAEEILKISAKTGEGIEELKKKLEEMIFAGEVSGEDALVASLRQLELLRACREQIQRAIKTAQQGLSEEFIASELRRAVELLGEISGESVSEEVLEIIFSKFCIGK